MTTSRADLIKRLEDAKEGNSSLDDQIHWLVKSGIGVGFNGSAPPYTTSLDAVMTLVPESYQWSVTDWRMEAFAQIGATVSTAKAKTPALALCIAALSALKASEPST